MFKLLFVPLFIGEGPDIQELLPGILFLGIILYFIIKKGNRKKSVHLALSKFSIDPTSELKIVLEGRKTGLIQWVLVQLKLGNMYKLHIRKEYISYSADSASGESLILTPVQKIASTSCGYHKPIGLLIIAAILVLSGLIFPIVMLWCFLIAVILVVLYIFGKSFFISIQTVGGDMFGFSFKRSFIENVSIDVEKIKEAIKQINALVLDAQ
jgi:hypothetical protein